MLWCNRRFSIKLSLNLRLSSFFSFNFAHSKSTGYGANKDHVRVLSVAIYLQLVEPKYVRYCSSQNGRGSVARYGKYLPVIYRQNKYRHTGILTYLLRLSSSRSKWNIGGRVVSTWIVWVYLHSNFRGGLPNTLVFWNNRVRSGPSRSFKLVDFGPNRKHVCDFLLVINSNFGPILPRFRWYCRFPGEKNDPTPIPPEFWLFPLH